MTKILSFFIPIFVINSGCFQTSKSISQRPSSIYSPSPRSTGNLIYKL